MGEIEILKSIPLNGPKKEEKKQDEKKVEKVVTGAVSVKKPSAASSIFRSFISEDAGNVKNYILTDVIIPAVKDTLYDAINNTFSMLLFGSTNGRTKGGTSTKNQPSYASYYKSNNKSTSVRTSRDVLNLDDIVIEHRNEAEDVLDHMFDMLDAYGSVTVAELYDMLGMQCDYTCNKYGWKKLGTASIRRVHGGGYLLDLPRPIYLD